MNNMLFVNVIACCDSCGKEIKKETFLNKVHSPVWLELSKEIKERGWQMTLSNDKNYWDIQCYDCRRKNK